MNFGFEQETIHDLMLLLAIAYIPLYGAGKV